VFAPPVNLIAPTEPSPVPEIVIASGTVIVFEIDNVAPLATVDALAVVPRALAWVIATIPSEIVVAPV